MGQPQVALTSPLTSFSPSYSWKSFVGESQLSNAYLELLFPSDFGSENFLLR